MSRKRHWGLIMVSLLGGWPVSTDFGGGSAVSANYSTDSLGTLTVCCVVFDDGGDGCISGSDSFRLFTHGGAVAFSSPVAYTADLIYGPAGEMIGTGLASSGGRAHSIPQLSAALPSAHSCNMRMRRTSEVPADVKD